AGAEGGRDPGARALPFGRSVHARANERREILRAPRADRRSDGRRRGGESRGVTESAIPGWLYRRRLFRLAGIRNFEWHWGAQNRSRGGPDFDRAGRAGNAGTYGVLRAARDRQTPAG